MNSSVSRLWTCSRCLRAQKLRGTSTHIESTSRTIGRSLNRFSTTAISQDERPPDHARRASSPQPKDDSQDAEGRGAMSRRLVEMAEETIDAGSKSDRKLMEDAGFSEELKKQLEEKISQTSFAAQNQRAASEVNISSAAGQGTRDIAGADAWTGSESLHDGALRMLDDSHKRLRTPYKPPHPVIKDLRPSGKKKLSPADRLATAREKTSIYAISQQSDMSPEEREKYRKELKERFSGPAARPMPTTMQGLTTLANERIEDAIARGQFKNLPRGKGKNVERDYNANSPFLDTTEYFMNKIIQKQEIVPPWIEKQQELVKEANSFRGRLRNDWRRHSARMISSRGGTVQEQVDRAKRYAMAEERVNPRLAKKVENFSAIAGDGTLTTVTVEEKIAQGVSIEDEAAAEQILEDGGAPLQEQVEIKELKVTAQAAEDAATTELTPIVETPTLLVLSSSTISPPISSEPSPTASTNISSSTQAPLHPMQNPFRDPSWERTEFAYHTLAIQNLNALTRSYNLMSPKIAQKPYFTLTRELNRCFADVAPTVASEILERSGRRKSRVEVIRHREGGVLERFGEGWKGHEGVIRDERSEKGYGFKEFWKDLFAKEEKRDRREKDVA